MGQQKIHNKRKRRSMAILKQALNKINCINKSQYTFFVTLIKGLIGSTGKKTFRNLARYANLTEHTFARQMTKASNFIALNIEMIKSSKNDDDVLIAAQDASFIKKAGKHTAGLDTFWNGCASKAEKGLEIDVIAVIKCTEEKKEGYTLSAKQTPPNTASNNKGAKKNKGTRTRIDFYLEHVKQVRSQLLNLGIQYMVADAFFAKNKYVNGIASFGLNVISKLRKDARLHHLYTGPQKSRGRKRIMEEHKIDAEDYKDPVTLEIGNGCAKLSSGIAYSPSLKRKIKVVLVEKKMGNKVGRATLFSTNIEQNALQIYQFYVARFQIEFIFRDAKGFTGLTDCQSRDPRRLHYRFNASLTALNFAKLQDHESQKAKASQHPFSMTNLAREYHVEIDVDRFISMFGLDQKLIKLHPSYGNMRSFANVRH